MPPVEDKWRAKDTSDEEPSPPESNLDQEDNQQEGNLKEDEQQGMNKKIIMLMSTLSAKLEQKTAQERALSNPNRINKYTIRNVVN